MYARGNVKRICFLVKIGLKGRMLKENDDQNLCKKRGKEKTTRVKPGVRAEEMLVEMGKGNRKEKDEACKGLQVLRGL